MFVEFKLSTKMINDTDNVWFSHDKIRFIYDDSLSDSSLGSKVARPLDSRIMKPASTTGITVYLGIPVIRATISSHISLSLSNMWFSLHMIPFWHKRSGSSHSGHFLPLRWRVLIIVGVDMDEDELLFKNIHVSFISILFFVSTLTHSLTPSYAQNGCARGYYPGESQTGRLNDALI